MAGHDHNHAHDHSHGHGQNNKKVLLFSFIIITAYMLVEAFGGFFTNSLALLSDAGHMLSDSLALAIALLAFKFGEKAVDRFVNPPEVATVGMLVISSIGLLMNILVAWIMMRGSDTEHNLNMRGAYLHVISDMLGSIGAIIAALLMMFFGWGWADPVASVIVAVLVLRSGYYVSKSSLHVLMEGTPRNIDVEEVVQAISQFEGVKAVHDVHIWTITSNLNMLTAHIVVDGNRTVYEVDALLQKIQHMLEHKHIPHSTLQIESEKHGHDESVLCNVKAGAPDAHAHHHH